MLDCSADNEEMEERRRDDESCMDNRNLQEPSCDTRKHTEDQTDEKSQESGCSGGPSWQPQESDCLPSILLAALLALIFVSVSVVIICQEAVHFPLRDLKALSPNGDGCPKGNLQSLPLFFPNQPKTTWRTVLRYIDNPRPEESWILVGIGPGDTSQTLLCFTKTMLSLPTQAKSIGVEFLDSTSPWLPPMGSSENTTWLISSVKVLQAEKSLLNGLVVSLESHQHGKGEVTKNTFALVGEQIQERLLLQRLMPSLISRILTLNPDRGLKTMTIDREDFLVLFVAAEPYLESGLVCLACSWQKEWIAQPSQLLQSRCE
ncbi:uncharacterized protein [Erythrolamprus reginae]|uniref:uncharacterized protein n=1 Tax=Erythrolamprus reginae TaxID=121349 RepID=UPI00396CA925